MRRLVATHRGSERIVYLCASFSVGKPLEKAVRRLSALEMRVGVNGLSECQRLDGAEAEQLHDHVVHSELPGCEDGLIWGLL